MTDKTMTNLIATIQDIHDQAKVRYGYAPQRVFIATAMKNRIIQEISDAMGADFVALRRKASDGMKLLGMRFMIDHKVPEDEMHFCTKRRELMVRVKVDQHPLPHPADHALPEAAYHKSPHPSAADNGALIGGASL